MCSESAYALVFRIVSVGFGSGSRLVHRGPLVQSASLTRVNRGLPTGDVGRSAILSDVTYE